MSLTDEGLEQKIEKAVDFLVKCSKNQMATAMKKLKALQSQRVSNFNPASCGTTGEKSNVGPRTLYSDDTD